MILNEILKKASQEHWALGHFNVSNLEQLKAVVEAAQDSKAPVMIGTSEGERAWLGLTEIVALISAERNNWPYIFLNADHTKTVQAAFDAADAGYDAIHFDGSTLSLEENIKSTQEVASYCKNINPDISVEGELGYLKGESQLTDKKVEISPSDYTDPGSARDFVKSTGIDRLGIAVGNVHGINLEEPKLDFERIKKIREAVSPDTALVLHAGSGIADEDIRRAIENGIANIHISTELRVAFRKGLEDSLKQNPNEYSPYKLDKKAVEDMKKIVMFKIKLFGAANKSN